jgi:TM2 domain-containing membrane protein YozV
MSGSENPYVALNNAQPPYSPQDPQQQEPPQQYQPPQQQQEQQYYQPPHIHPQQHQPQPIVSHQQFSDQWIEPVNPPNAIIAVLLSIFTFAGIGHMYLGQFKKGVSYLVTVITFWFVIILLTLLFGVGLLFIWVIYVWAIFIIIDSYQMAKRLQNRIPIMQGECHNIVSKFGVGLFVTGPTFVTGKSDAPIEWKQRMQQYNV